MATMNLFCVVEAFAVADSECETDAMFVRVLLVLLPLCTVIDWAVDSFSLISDGGFVVGLTGFEYLWIRMEMNELFFLLFFLMNDFDFEKKLRT